MSALNLPPNVWGYDARGRLIMSDDPRAVGRWDGTPVTVPLSVRE